MWLMCTLQLISIVMCAAIGWAFWSEEVAWSVLLGGMAVLIPNSIAALHITIAIQRNRAHAMLFFFSQVIKIALILTMLALVYQLYNQVIWPSLVLGLGVAAVAPLLLGVVQKHP